MRDRDPEALGVFFARYFDRVYGLVYRLLGERAAAEDVTSEVFFKVHQAAARLDPARDPEPWLTTIALNTCRDLWRSGPWRMARRSRPADDPVTAERLVAPGEGPEGAVLASERERLVQAAIARLPEPLRIAVVLHDYQGLSHQEVAAVTHVAHAAARKRYSRALALLGEMLEKELGS